MEQEGLIMASNYKAVKKFIANNCRSCGLILNKNTDADVIEKLDSVPSKRAYILELIRADIRKEKV